MGPGNYCQHQTIKILVTCQPPASAHSMTSMWSVKAVPNLRPSRAGFAFLFFTSCTSTCTFGWPRACIIDIKSRTNCQLCITFEGTVLKHRIPLPSSCIVMMQQLKRFAQSELGVFLKSAVGFVGTCCYISLDEKSHQSPKSKISILG